MQPTVFSELGGYKMAFKSWVGITLINTGTLVLSSVPVLESSVMSGPEKIRSRGSWSHIVSKATDA